MSYPELTWAKGSFKSISSKAGWLRGIDKERTGGPIVATLAENEIGFKAWLDARSSLGSNLPCTALSPAQKRCPGQKPGKVYTSSRPLGTHSIMNST